MSGSRATELLWTKQLLTFTVLMESLNPEKGSWLKDISGTSAGSEKRFLKGRLHKAFPRRGSSAPRTPTHLVPANSG